jgi:hypothetical protein
MAMDFYYWPRSGRNLDRAGFEALVVDLVEEKLVHPPFALVTGKIQAAISLDVTNFVRYRSDPDGRKLWKGRTLAGLVKALGKAEFGKSNIAVYFEGLDNENPAVRGAMDFDGGSEGDVVLYALARKQTIMVGDRKESFRQLKQFFILSEEGRYDDLRRTPIPAVLKRHFGDIATGSDSS